MFEVIDSTSEAGWPDSEAAAVSDGDEMVTPGKLPELKNVELQWWICVADFRDQVHH